MHVAHADFVAVVDERAAGHGQQECERELHFIGGQGVAHADHVVIARRNADVSRRSGGAGKHGRICVHKRLDVAARIADIVVIAIWIVSVDD